MTAKTVGDSVWTTRDVRPLVSSRALGVLVTRAIQMGLILWVHASGAGPAALALVLASFALPSIVFMGVAGHVADRHDSRTVLVGGAAVQVLAGLVLMAATLGAWESARLPLLALAGFAVQAASVFTNPVWDALVPRVVGDDRVPQVVSLQQGVSSAAGPLGAGLAGALWQWAGAWETFAAATAGTVLVLLGSLAVRTRRAPLAEGTDEGAPGPTGIRLLAHTIVSGWGVLRGHRLALLLVATMVPFIVAMETLNVVEVFLVRDEIGATSAQYGLSEAFAAVGAVAGSVLAGRVPTPRARLHAFGAALAGACLVALATGLAPAFWLYLALTIAMGLANAMAMAMLTTLLVTGTPDAQRGRVMATTGGLARLASVGAMVVGAVLAEVLSPREVYLVVGLVALFVVLAQMPRILLASATAAQHPADAPTSRVGRHRHRSLA